MEFEWDEKKNSENIKKHGINFQEAEKAFEDENAVELFDEINSESEVRFQIIALSPKDFCLLHSPPERKLSVLSRQQKLTPNT